MKVDLKCFAELSEGDVCDFTGSDQYEISEGETVENLIDRLGMPKEEIKIIFLNNKIVFFLSYPLILIIPSSLSLTLLDIN